MCLLNENRIFYHIYPLGFCGVLKSNNYNSNFLKKFDKNWIEHIYELGCNCVYFGPIFHSTYHGYDTIDYLNIDPRLGNNNEFFEIVNKLHSKNIQVIIDGVFNHVGRDFWAFKDVLSKKENSKYSNWFYIDFNRDSIKNDGLYYEGWEGHYDLVKLNLKNKEVIEYIFLVIDSWINEFDIDGIRLDVAYSLPQEFIKELKNHVNKKEKSIWLMGEMIHGDYNGIVSDEKLDSATNYEVYKGIYSSHNDKNYFEIAYSLNRQFGDTGIYKNKKLYNFVDNHDVNRIMTMLNNKKHIFNVYTLLFTIPGIPSIYYGSEWGIEGDRTITDLNLRPEIDLNDFINNSNAMHIENHIKSLAAIREKYEALINGIYVQFLVRNKQFIYGRYIDNQWIYIALNLDESESTVEFNINKKTMVLKDLLKLGDEFKVNGYSVKINIPSYSARILI